jgi:hypothetical protein
LILDTKRGAIIARSTELIFDEVAELVTRANRPQPISMLLFCPHCHEQHVDAPDEQCDFSLTLRADMKLGGRCQLRKYHDGAHVCNNNTEPLHWTNPPHRSHLCGACGCVWRPADVPTVGVKRIQTRGSRDTWPQE